MDHLDLELLIEKIKKHPAIWDTSCEEYHDKVKKRCAWHCVCEDMDADFDLKEEKDKNEIGAKLMKRWKSMKDNFIRSEKKVTKSGQGAGSSRRYVYARQMSFLLKVHETAPTQTSVDLADNEPHKDDEEDVEQQMGDESTSNETSPNFYQIPAAKRRKILESSMLKFMNTPIPTVPPPPPENRDDDRAFFDSIIPMLKRLPMDIKLEFRCDVMQLLKAYRKRCHYAMTQKTSPQVVRQTTFPARFASSHQQQGIYSSHGQQINNQPKSMLHQTRQYEDLHQATSPYSEISIHEDEIVM